MMQRLLLNFDDWAANYGETVTAIELSPEGSGYRSKTRFAKFYNLPELMSTFKMVADIQTADMLKLPVPEAHYHNIALKPSEYQKEIVASLAERAEKVRNREVDSSVDNMLLITNDGTWAHGITSPKKHMDKIYDAVVEGDIPPDMGQRFADGIVLDDGLHCLSAKAVQTGPQSLTVVVQEGKFHQVKRCLLYTSPSPRD